MSGPAAAGHLGPTFFASVTLMVLAGWAIFGLWIGYDRRRRSRVSDATGTKRDRRNDAPLRVGSWPGPSFDDNAFISIFCDALVSAGAQVVDVGSPEDVVPATIDVLQVHWLEQVYWRGLSERRSELAALKVYLGLRRLRRAGVRLVWMVHNLRPHNASRRRLLVWSIYSKAAARLMDGFIALSPGTESVIASTFPFRPSVQTLAVRHPSYPGPVADASRSEARVKWSVTDSPRVLVFLGSIKPYKGVEVLIDIARALPQACSIVIAGECRDDGLRQGLPEMVASVANVDLRLHRLSPEAFEGIGLASDYVVLPFTEFLHSGSVIHALSLGRPVVTASTAYTEDLRDVIGTEWLQLYRGELTPEFISQLPPAPPGSPDLSALSPDRLGGDVLRLYEKLTGA